MKIKRIHQQHSFMKKKKKIVTFVLLALKGLSMYFLFWPKN